MLFKGVQHSKCLKFGGIRGKNRQLCPFYWTFLPFFGYAAGMPLFSRITPGLGSVTVL